MKILTISIAAAAFAALTGAATAQQLPQHYPQTPAVSPSQTMQSPGGADGGLEPDDTPVSRPGVVAGEVPIGTTGAASREGEPVPAPRRASPAAPVPAAPGGAAPVNPSR